MKTRERNYILIKKACNNNRGCGEFPYFGARYPDATCIEGLLWDLDSSEADGLLYSGGDDVCPFCNTLEFIRDHHLDRGFALKQVTDWIIQLRRKYT